MWKGAYLARVELTDENSEKQERDDTEKWDAWLKEVNKDTCHHTLFWGPGCPRNRLVKMSYFYALYFFFFWHFKGETIHNKP